MILVKLFRLISSVTCSLRQEQRDTFFHISSQYAYCHIRRRAAEFTALGFVHILANNYIPPWDGLVNCFPTTDRRVFPSFRVRCPV